MSAVPHFSQTYAEARTKFFAGAQSRHLDVETQALPDWKGIDGEALAMDVALGGVTDAPGLLIVTSATHGVEGYCGSGCQIDPARRRLGALADARVGCSGSCSQSARSTAVR
jgi:hypothetical protein